MMSQQQLFAYCPQALYGDGCTDSTCPLIHDAKYCRPCGVLCSPASTYKTHISSPAHDKVLARQVIWRHCPVCDIVITAGVDVWALHIAGRRHRNNATRVGVKPASVTSTVPPKHAPALMLCEACDLTINVYAWETHVNGRQHQVHERHAKFRHAFEQAARDRDDVKVSHGESGLDFGVISLDTATSGLHGILSLSAIGSDPITLLSVEIFSQNRSQNAGAPYAYH